MLQDDVGVYENVDMRWCCYWLLCWYEKMLLLMIMSLRWDEVDVKNDIEMRWYWCWEWHRDEMMLMLIMTLRWNVVDVENVIVMMYDVYVHGGAVTMMDIPSGGIKVVKEF